MIIFRRGRDYWREIQHAYMFFSSWWMCSCHMGPSLPYCRDSGIMITVQYLQGKDCHFQDKTVISHRPFCCADRRVKG